MFNAVSFKNEVELTKFINGHNIKKKDIEMITFDHKNHTWYLLYWSASKNA